MKQHRIALEQAAKRFGGTVIEQRLVTMYDRATARMEGSEKKSVQTQDPFPVHLYELEFKVRDISTKAVRVLDVESGHYVKLTRVAEGTPYLLEVGLIACAEEVSQGQSNIKAW